MQEYFHGTDELQEPETVQSLQWCLLERNDKLIPVAARQLELHHVLLKIRGGDDRMYFLCAPIAVFVRPLLLKAQAYHKSQTSANPLSIASSNKDPVRRICSWQDRV